MVAALALGPLAAHAGHPEMARYTNDPDEVFWFLQITDSHIDTFLYGREVEQLELALGEAVDVIQPLFVVNTGDLTDHTDGVNYLGPPVLDEWMLYRGIADDAGMGADYYFDIPGNHDYYGDDGTFYLTYSIQGEETGTTQPHWTLDMPWGLYHFVSCATPHNDATPLPWPFDNKTFTEEEIDEVEANLLVHTAARLTFAFGHHDLEDTGNAASMRTLFLDYGVAHYAHGHEHALGTREAHGIVRFMCDAIGQNPDRNLCIWAVDSDGISWGVTDASEPWPAAVITAPVDARLGPDDDVDNPYAPAVPNGCVEAPLRVLAFDASSITEMLFQVDDGGLHTLTENPSLPNQWLGSFDATSLVAGIHRIDVQVHGEGWRHFSSQFRVEDLPCELEPEPPDEETEPTPEPMAEPEDMEPVAEVPLDGALDVVNDPARDGEDEGSDVALRGGGCGCSIAR